MCDSDLKSTVGDGSLCGWTKQDFIDEIMQQRVIVCSKDSTSEDRINAITNASTLVLMCSDRKFRETTLRNIIEEMKARDEMLLRLEFNKLYQ